VGEDDYRILPFEDAAGVSERDVVDLWLAETELDEAVATERVREIAFVALDGGGALVGVSTTYISHDRRLRTEIWHMRAFVAALHRESDIATRLVRATRQHLETRWVAGDDLRAPGILMEVENPILKQFANQAVWVRPETPEGQWMFIGENARGDHLRVYWFPGARAPLPS